MFSRQSSAYLIQPLCVCLKAKAILYNYMHRRGLGEMIDPKLSMHLSWTKTFIEANPQTELKLLCSISLVRRSYQADVRYCRPQAHALLSLADKRCLCVGLMAYLHAGPLVNLYWLFGFEPIGPAVPFLRAKYTAGWHNGAAYNAERVLYTTVSFIAVSDVLLNVRTAIILGPK